MSTIKLSEMSVGDRGYLPGEDVCAELRDGGLSGGAEHDLYLALIEPDDDLPTITVDTDEVAL